MANFIQTDEGAALEREQGNSDLFLYVATIHINHTPGESGRFFMLCYQKLERDGEPDRAGIKEMFRRISKNVLLLHEEALERGLIRRVG